MKPNEFEAYESKALYTIRFLIARIILLVIALCLLPTLSLVLEVQLSHYYQFTERQLQKVDASITIFGIAFVIGIFCCGASIGVINQNIEYEKARMRNGH